MAGEPAANKVPETMAANPAAPPVSSATPALLRLLKTSPERGPAGTSITLTGAGLPPGKAADIIWVTVDGSYDTTDSKPGQPLGLEYRRQVFSEKRGSVGLASISTDGLVTAAFAAPEDYGELHDIYLAVDGQDVAKGGFRLMRSFTMNPLEGSVGTVIKVKVTGLGWKPFESTAALRWDNRYTGFITAVTTRGTAVFQFRAAGPVGKHYISIDSASHALPFLNITTGGSSTRHLLPFEVVFTVTADNGPPEARVEWPDPARVAEIGNGRTLRIPTMGEVVSAPAVSPDLSPTSGPALTRATVRVRGLSPGPVELVWLTGRQYDSAGNPVPAWLEAPRLASVTAGRDGRIEATVTIPEGVGGWRVIAVVQNGRTLAEVPFYVEQSLATTAPVRVKAGEKFTVSFRGGGWTELDNGAAVTYDNAYIGYVCGYANNGDTPVELVATGGPGTHLVDIYPYIFDGGHGDWPWQYNLPQLTFAQDHPGLPLGYRLPAYRLAIEVVP
ncbi:MAG: hypothetical protein Q8P00_02470 [Dehalococcoidia bacterium]|nr:hypothetical protein [Dehalococcoidia bacterium]